ncbi:MAG: DUF411 domain-containing protein [bacterium]|nr:DUF411 domain-containing protein [bacterium]MCP5070792.1 DUF411 domain-containing protein [bacterium]
MIQRLLVANLLFLVFSSPILAEAPTLKVYKSPTCGCCNAWIDHLESHGFQVQAENRSDMQTVKSTNGIRAEFSSCHTGFVGGYFIEGHVPATEIQRLLREKPPIAGLSVPAMPIGSPGMEGPNPEPYDVLAIGRDGKSRIWSSHGPGHEH